jgi:hypothetical protein
MIAIIILTVLVIGITGFYFISKKKTDDNPSLVITTDPSTTPVQTSLNCSPGFFVNQTNNTCDQCPVNTYSIITNAPSCSLCPSNTIPNGSRTACDTTVVSCRNGQYRDPINNICLQCPAGTINNDPNSTYCSPCTAPFLRANADQSWCELTK